MWSTRLRLSIPALILTLLVGCQSDQAKLAEHMARGEEYAKQGKAPEAIIEFKSVLQIDPNHAPAHHGLALAYLRNRQAREGYWEMRETVRLDPSNLEARLEFGQLAALAGENEEVMAQADAVIAADPKRVEAYLLRAQALEVLKRPEEALQTAEKAVEVDPKSSQGLKLLAQMYDARGKAELAEATYKRNIEVANDANAHAIYGRFLVRYYKRERADEAEAAYRTAIEVAKPDEIVDAYSVLAGFLFGRNRFDELVTALEGGIAKHPDSIELLYLLARFYSAHGEEPKARELLEQATKAKPNDPRPFLILSAYQGRLGDSAGALAAAEQALAVAPQDESARLRKAELLVEVGFKEGDTARIEEGRTIVDGILAETPSNPGALFVRAKIELSLKKIDDAITSVRTAINGKPNWAEAYYLLGAALAIKGDNTAARNELARALEIDPNLYQAQQVLAKVHAALGEHEYAVEVGRRYLQRQPDNIETNLIVAQSLVRLGKLQEAKSQIEKIDEAKRGAEGNYALGRIYFGLGDVAKARSYFELANAAVPRNPDILTNLLTLDARENRLAESTERINAAIAAEPGNAKLQQLAGMLAQMSGRPEEAEAAYKKAVELDPSDLTGYERLARLYSAMGRLDQTVAIYEKAREVQPDNATINHFRGVLYELGGKRELALQRYEDAIRLDPNLGEAKNNLAYLLAENNQNLERALDLAQEAKTQLPESASVADTLGWVMHKRGMHSAAISYLKEAEAGTDPNDANIGVVRYHLALAYEANGESEQARDALKRALAGLDKQMQAARTKGATPGEPPWANDVRAMLSRLDARG
jgi:tetratricopeptide (TPR) repeat protein